MLTTHDLVVTADVINAGVEVTLETEPGTHCHAVTLTADDLATIKAGGVVKKVTCNGGDHEYVIGCGMNLPAPVVPDSVMCPGEMPGACN